ncbi:hypothetical protein PGTUg99_022934 [Puccinia graminis f. sp. tritici]|uniref:Uncharacterized protein n=1 Tax=Puccinia graminis f. sp. tritici TaxID=56615 RepID=A0A5B0RW08_PUCGR|nr:hypothetical protein PGTUg99_022934 [Puccinia graminis f. sp. tritici]
MFPDGIIEDYSTSSENTHMIWPELGLQHSNDMLASSLGSSGVNNGYMERDSNHTGKNTYSLWGDGETRHDHLEINPQSEAHLATHHPETNHASEKDKQLWKKIQELSHLESGLFFASSSIFGNFREVGHKDKESGVLHGEEFNQVLGVHQQQNQQPRKRPQDVPPIKNLFQPQNTASKQEKKELKQQRNRYGRLSPHTQGAQEDYFGNGDTMIILVRKARSSLEHLDIGAFREWKKFEDKIEKHKEDIIRLYKLPSKTPGLMIISGPSEETWDSSMVFEHIKITRIAPNSNSGPYAASKIIINRIHEIGEALHLCHHWFHQNGIEGKLLGKTKGTHRRILEWFFSLIFMETEECLPLLGRSKIPKESGTKLFNNAQNIILKSLVMNKKFSKFKAFKTALDLMPLWFQKEGSTHSPKHYEQLAALITKNVNYIS